MSKKRAAYCGPVVLSRFWLIHATAKETNAPRSTAHKIPLRAVDYIFLVVVNGALLLAIFLL
ncbi:MAG: hypothetical protein ACOX1T_08005 [Saccharofermentanales bacterium]